MSRTALAHRSRGRRFPPWSSASSAVDDVESALRQRTAAVEDVGGDLPLAPALAPHDDVLAVVLDAGRRAVHAESVGADLAREVARLRDFHRGRHPTERE